MKFFGMRIDNLILISLKVSAKVTCSHPYFQSGMSAIVWCGRGDWVVGFVSLATLKTTELVYNWHVFIKASVLFILLYVLDKVHFNIMNVGLSVQEVKSVPSPGFWQYFSSHDPETYAQCPGICKHNINNNAYNTCY